MEENRAYTCVCVCVCVYLLLVALARQHDKLHGVGDVGVALPGACWAGPLLQLALQLQGDGYVQLVHLDRLAAALLNHGHTHSETS